MCRLKALVAVLISTWASGLAAHAEPVRVNGHELTPKQAQMLKDIAQKVIPALPGSSLAERVETAARATWWSLREGVLSDWNFKRVPVHRFSSCSRTCRPGRNCRDCTKDPIGKEYKEYDCLLEPLEVCDIGKAWQVGLAAVQPYTPQNNWLAQEKFVLSIVKRCWDGQKSVEDVLREAAELALVKPAERDVIASLGPGPLRTSWLLRHPVVGFFVVADQEVMPECFPSQGQPKGFCFNRQTDEARLYAATPEDAKRSLNDLGRIFMSLVRSR